MNPNTGELKMLTRDEKREGFERLPSELELLARIKMSRQEAAQPAVVNLMSRTPLAEWAKKKRKAKTAAASKRRNRK